MSQELVLLGALANRDGQTRNSDLAQELSALLPVYVLRPRPGSIRAAAFDWQAILNTTADLIAVGDLLWAAYERYIKPLRQRNSQSRAFLLIQVKDRNGRFTQLSLGQEDMEREVFIKSFTRSVTVLRTETEPDGTATSFEEKLEESGEWVRIK